MRPLYSISTKYYQFLFKHKSNAPFLSGDSFKLISRSIFNNEEKKVKIINSSQLNILFVKGDYLEEFFNCYDRRTENLILLVGNSDRNYSHIFSYPNFIKKIYAQNLGIPNSDKFECLPIGLENLSIGQSGRKKYFKPIKNFDIIDKIIFPPMAPRNEKRKYFLSYALKNKTIFDVYTNYLNENKYFSLLGNYKFVLTSEGNGFDDHRIWESLYRNQIPIVIKGEKNSPFWIWTENLTKLNLPILFVDSIEDLNKDLILNFYYRCLNVNLSQSLPLWLNYWVQKFRFDLQQ